MRTKNTSEIHTARSLQAAFGYLFEEEIDALDELVKSLPDYPVVLQIGAGAGTASLAILESRDDVILTTVDIENKDSPLGSLFSEKKVVEDAEYARRLLQIHGDSKAIGCGWPGEQFNMIFIDGDHSYAGCAGDIMAWLPHLKQGGIMAVHDYEKHKAYDGLSPDAKAPHPKVWDGVDKAVNELLLDKYEKILHVRSLVAFRV